MVVNQFEAPAEKFADAFVLIIAYLAKGMDGEKPVIGKYSSGNEYEIVKFHSADRLALNEAFWRSIQKKTQTSFEVAPIN